jgi:hypothetical protein
MFNVCIFRPMNFQRQLVERIIVALTYAERPPGITTLHLPPDTDSLGLLAVSLFLRLVFQLEQEAL